MVRTPQRTSRTVRRLLWRIPGEVVAPTDVGRPAWVWVLGVVPWEGQARGNWASHPLHVTLVPSWEPT